MTAKWEDREQPILEAIAELEEAGADASVDSVSQSAGIDRAIVGRSVKRLYDADFVDAHDVTSLGDRTPNYISIELRERGLRVIGQWPPQISDAFIGRLEALISSEGDPTERSRLERLRAAASDVSKGVVSGAIVAAGQWGSGGL